MRCVIGEQVYKLSRDDLKEMVGANIGIRLFSQLQRDRARVRILVYQPGLIGRGWMEGKGAVFKAACIDMVTVIIIIAVSLH